MQFRSTRAAWLVIALLGCGLGSTGCSGKKTFELVPCKGTLTVDGKKLEGLLVQIMPDATEGEKKAPEGPTSFGVTDANGNFEMTCSDGRPGAFPGPHLVTVVDQKEERPAQGEDPKGTPRLNPKFASGASKVKVVVAAGQDLKIDLKNEW